MIERINRVYNNLDIKDSKMKSTIRKEVISAILVKKTVWKLRHRKVTSSFALEGDNIIKNIEITVVKCGLGPLQRTVFS